MVIMSTKDIKNKVNPKRQLAATIGLAKVAVLQPTVRFLNF